MRTIVAMSPADPVIAARRKPIGIGQVGLGVISGVHREGYRCLGLPVVAGCDPAPAARDRFAAQEPEATVYDSLDNLLADEKVGVIDLATQHHRETRIPVLERIAAAGKPVLIQKPFAMNYADAVEAAELLEHAGVPAMVNQNMCFTPGALALERALMVDRMVGEPSYAQMMMQFPFDVYYQSSMARDERWWTVGLTVHHLGLFQLLFGPPERVYALLGRDVAQISTPHEGYGHLALTYGSGLHVLIISTGTYYGPRQILHTKEAAWVQGPDGLIDWSPEGPVVLLRRTGDAGKTIKETAIETPVGTWFPHAFGLAMDHFQASLAQKTTPWCPIADNLYVMAVLEAAYRSSAEGRAVEVREVMGERYDAAYGTGWSHATTSWEAPVVASEIAGASS
jgi:predicted dehydrogenase